MNITRKKVEENIKSKLSGDLRKNALDFVKFVYKTGGWNHLIQTEPIKVYVNICYPVFKGNDITFMFWNGGNPTPHTNPNADTFVRMKNLALEIQKHSNTANLITIRYVLQNSSKRKRPNIKEVIESCLVEDPRRSALDFVDFVYENGMTFEPHASNWQEFYLKAKSGARLGQMGIRGSDDWRYHHMTIPGEAQRWLFCMYYHADTNEHTTDYSVLNKALHAPLFYCCFKDDPNRTGVNSTCMKCKNSADRTIFGIKYECLCHVAHPTFANPNDVALKVIKKFILILTLGNRL